MSVKKRIALGSDHIGLELRGVIKAFLDEQGIEVLDLGTFSRERTDYPVYAEKVARAILSGEAERGILICGTGVGMSIAANKISGIRAVVCSEPYSAVLARQHNDANVLALGARVVGNGLACTIVKLWLEAEFEGGRHRNRLKMIEEFEKRMEANQAGQKGQMA